MKRTTLLSLVTATLLAACSQSSPPAAGNLPQPPGATASLAERAAWLKQRPELQDADSQALLQRYGNDPTFLASIERAYTGAPEPSVAPQIQRPTLSPNLAPLDLTSDRLNFIKSVAWGSVPNYDLEYANPGATNAVLPGLDWSRNGCSAPDGLGLGYREDFRPACNVHDFGYRNLKVYERTEQNREITDDVFLRNMNITCVAKTWYKRPACYAAAYAYYQGVRLGGDSSFQ